ncbi:protease HtpX [Neisseriaceae bacterium PsAf]|nr:protease HtpX [Neisseriaceae bacterium PsAf]
MKRIFYYLMTNIAVIAMISLVLFIAQLAGVPIDTASMSGLLVFSIIVGFTGSIISLWISRWMALRSVGGRIIETPQTEEEQWLVNTVARLAQEWGFKTPQVTIYNSNDPNAFATGPTKNRSLVAVSSGLLNIMTRDEVEGVLGHEIAHIGNGDMVTMTLMQGVLNTFVVFFSRIIANIVEERFELGGAAYIAVVIVLQILFGLLASLILMWYSRRREYRADEGSAQHVGAPKMIASLQKLGKITQQEPLPQEVNAFGIAGSKDSIFSTHPSTENRILALQGLKKI